MKIDPERIRRLHFGYIVAPQGTLFEELDPV